MLVLVNSYLETHKMSECQKQFLVRELFSKCTILTMACIVRKQHNRLIPLPTQHASEALSQKQKKERHTLPIGDKLPPILTSSNTQPAMPDYTSIPLLASHHL